MASSESEVKNEGEEKQAVEPIRLPTIEEIRGQDIWNNCTVRSVVSGVMGGGLGLFMGLFLGALDNPLMHEEMTAKQQFVYTAKQMGRRSWGSAKAFALTGLTFSAAKCIVEKARAKHDMTNTVVAGCVTGGTMFARGFVWLLSSPINILARLLFMLTASILSHLAWSGQLVGSCRVIFIPD